MNFDANNPQNVTAKFLNGTEAGREFGTSQPDTVYTILFLCLRLLVACISLVSSVCVLTALFRIKRIALKPKLLLINGVTTDVFFGLAMGFVGIVNSLEPLGIIGTNDFSCIRYVANFITPAIQYAQVLGCLVLTLDRVYAVAVPFRYRSHAYPPILSAFILVVVWACVVGLVVPVFWVSGYNARWKGPCSQMGIGHASWTIQIRFPLVIGVSLLNFVLYCCLFLFLRCRRDIMEGPAAQNGSHKQSLSLAVTFFSVQLSVMLLYLPGPLFDILLRAAKIWLNPTIKKRTRYVFILLFTLIPVLNAAILAQRIPAIKAEVKKVLRKQTVTGSAHSKDLSEEKGISGNTTSSDFKGLDATKNTKDK